MKEYMTVNGLLKSVMNEEFYENGVLKECFLEDECVLQTPQGAFIPKYDYSDVRSKYRNSLSFYKSGQLKSVYLQNRTKIKSPVVDIEAEMITYYETGELHRLFPFYGKISGYWSEEEELSALEPFTGTVNGISFHHKVACYCFYSSGRIKSLTLAGNEELIVDSSVGTVHVRMGISFYDSGKIRSVEPEAETNIKTPVGTITAYDNTPIAVHGDDNSLKFTEDGRLLSVKTIKSGFEIIDHENKKIQILPKCRRSYWDIEKFEMVPVEVIFREEGVDILDSDGWIYEYSFHDHQIKSITNKLYKTETGCTNCASCSECQ